MPETSSHLGLYRAGLTSPQHRQYITVARSAIAQDTLEILRGNASRRSKHHFLFIGPRGIGKTHLLSLIEDEIAVDSDLTAQYVVVRFPEESHRTLSFADFLLGLCEILRDELKDEPLWGEMYDRLQIEQDDSVIVDTLVPALRKENRARKRTMLVMLENLNEIFTNQIRNRKDIAALRKFFMDDNRCLLMATAPLHFDAVTDVGQPFYDFFDTQILENLSEQDTLDLIRLNLEWEKRRDLLDEFDSLRPRLLSLYRMTGGNPRLVVMLYELLAYDSITAVQQQFQLLLDRITPFYQDRMRDLPAQERAVLEMIACMRDQEKTPAAIAGQMRLSPQQASSLLKRLSQSHYLRSTPHPKDKRSRLYTIREGFFDIWLAMNLSRGARQRLPFLLDFFNLFYPSFEAREQKRAELRQQMADSQDADAEQALDYLSEVGTPDEKGATKLALASHYAQLGDAKQARQYLSEAEPLAMDSVGTWIVRHADSDASTNYLTELQEMIECWDLHRSGDLEAFAERLVKLGESLTYRTYSEAKLDFLRDDLKHLTDVKQRIEQRLRIADLFHVLARWNEAEKQLDIAKHEAENLEDPGATAGVLNDLAQLLQATNRLEEAEPLMRQALQIDEKSFGPDHPDVARDLNNLAQLLKATNRMEEAESLMRRVIEIFQKSLGENHPNVAVSLNNLAQLLKATNRMEEAEPLMRQALQMDEKSFGPDHPDVAIDLNNLAGLLQATNRLEEAEPLMRQALQIDEKSFGPDHPNVAIHLNNLAQLLQATNRLEEAEPLMRQALQIDEKSFGSDHPNVAIHLNNLAQLLQATNRLEEAEPLMRQALQIDEKSFGSDHPKVAIRLNNLAQLLQATNRLEEAEPLMRRGLEILLDFQRKTGHPHPHVNAAIQNYNLLL